MKRRVWLSLFVLVMLLLTMACIGGGKNNGSGSGDTDDPTIEVTEESNDDEDTPATSGKDFEITIENESPDEICYVQISLETSESWGEDKLGSDESIEPGDSKTIALEEGVYDVMLRDCDQVPMYSTSKLDSDATLTVGLPGKEAVIVLNNESSTDIWYVLISPSNEDSWGDDYLGGVEVIQAGNSRRFYVEPGTYDMMVAGEDQETLVEEKNVDLEAGETPWEISD